MRGVCVASFGGGGAPFIEGRRGAVRTATGGRRRREDKGGEAGARAAAWAGGAGRRAAR